MMIQVGVNVCAYIISICFEYRVLQSFKNPSKAEA